MYQVTQWKISCILDLRMKYCFLKSTKVKAGLPRWDRGSRTFDNSYGKGRIMRISKRANNINFWFSRFNSLYAHAFVIIKILHNSRSCLLVRGIILQSMTQTKQTIENLYEAWLRPSPIKFLGFNWIMI